ncbi:UDP-N-acetyl-D-mannosamine transferase, partial [Brachyspira hampsonii]|nr:UDP-N-acetyl-D-mannosamine transferase [Brachyspira hampsonii]
YESFYAKKNVFRVFLYIDYIRFWILVFFEKLTTKKDKKNTVSNN